MMFTYFLRIIAILMLPLAASAQEPEEFQYGPRPPLAVFDPGGILDAGQTLEISAPLTSIRDKEKVDVFAVVLKTLGDAPPEHVAGLFAAAWCDTQIHCIVLHVPGSKDSPWIIPGGRLIDFVTTEQVTRAVDNIRRHALAETTDFAKVNTASNETSDLLRYWLASAKNHNEIVLTETGKIRAEQRMETRKWRIVILGVVASVIPLLIGLAVTIAFLRRRGPAKFPTHSWQPRLGAPYGGGNHLTVTFPPTRKGSP